MGNLFKSGAADFPTSQGRITDNFPQARQENFRKERFLGFYASELGISPKHLARTVKAQTGMTAVSWIERLVVLEAQGHAEILQPQHTADFRRTQLQVSVVFRKILQEIHRNVAQGIPQLQALIRIKAHSTSPDLSPARLIRHSNRGVRLADFHSHILASRTLFRIFA